MYIRLQTDYFFPFERNLTAIVESLKIQIEVSC
jgi:hypothetical protein